MTEEGKEQGLRDRLRHEWALFLEKKWYFVMFFVVDFWLAVIVFRNLAFYRYRVGDRLVDLGFEVIPEYSGPLTNMPLYVLIALAAATALLSLRPGR
jgi:hypothetical protein